MKIIKAMVLAGMVSFVAACGGGGGSSDAAKTAAINSFNDFGTIVSSAAVQQCVQMLAPTCDCPGGGTITVSVATQTLTLNNCQSAAGMNYNGTITVDEGLTEITADMTVFGECTNATGTVSTNACNGNIEGTCAGGSVSCNVVDDAAAAGECTLSC